MRFRSLAAVVAALAPATISLAQVDGPPFVDAWVDPCVGDDATGVVGDRTQPFATVQRAITELRFAGVSPANPGLVHCNPGIYGPVSAGGNGEPLPIQLRDNVSLQGTGAKRTVIRGDGSDRVNGRFFQPLPFGNTRPLAEALVDATFLVDPGYDEFVDGFTFQGGDIQVYAETEAHDVHFAVSNCAFDMLEASPDLVEAGLMLPTPAFGVLMVHTFDLALFQKPEMRVPIDIMSETTIEPGYWDIWCHLLNNTFIQAWRPDDDELVAMGGAGSVAICDVANTVVNDPQFPKADPDPNPVYRGVGNPNIQNNLIRGSGTDGGAWAMLGIDQSDTTVVVGTVPAGTATNAFDPQFVGGNNGRFTSQIIGVNPPTALIPDPQAANPTGLPQADPAFVGEWLTKDRNLGLGQGRDWRLLPGSALADLGAAPLNNAQLMAANGTMYLQGPAATRLPEWAFDFDGEHWGNVRFQGANPDIGFDETDLTVFAGAYFNDNRSRADNGGVFPAELCTPGPAGSNRFVLVPMTTGQCTLFTAYHPLFIGLNDYAAWSAHPGSSVPGGFVPGQIPGFPFTAIWIAANNPANPFIFTAPGFSQAINPSGLYSPPNDPATVLNFGRINDPAIDRSVVFLGGYVTEQVLINSGGVLGVSNSQATYVSEPGQVSQIP
ncbi:MAG: hypothetical protein AB8G96_05725 [Phycisphaerales bacterium]